MPRGPFHIFCRCPSIFQLFPKPLLQKRIEKNIAMVVNAIGKHQALLLQIHDFDMPPGLSQYDPLRCVCCKRSEVRMPIQDSFLYLGHVTAASWSIGFDLHAYLLFLIESCWVCDIHVYTASCSQRDDVTLACKLRMQEPINFMLRSSENMWSLLGLKKIEDWDHKSLWSRKWTNGLISKAEIENHRNLVEVRCLPNPKRGIGFIAVVFCYTHCSFPEKPAALLSWWLGWCKLVPLKDSLLARVSNFFRLAQEKWQPICWSHAKSAALEWHASIDEMLPCQDSCRLVLLLSSYPCWAVGPICIHMFISFLCLLVSFRFCHGWPIFCQ